MSDDRSDSDWSVLPFWIKTSLQNQERWQPSLIFLVFSTEPTQNVKYRVSLKHLLPTWLFNQGRFPVRLHCQYALKQICFLAFPRVYLEYFSGTLKLFSKCPSIHSKLNRILAQWESLSFFKSDKQFYSSTVQSSTGGVVYQVQSTTQPPQTHPTRTHTLGAETDTWTHLHGTIRQIQW